MPLVSVLTPSLDQAEWLSDNLRSVACQTYPRVEHIVMDGGSTDGTVTLLEAAGDTVSWRSELDRGQADAVNNAFAASGGDIIGWINSDDAYFDCRVVADVVAFFAKNPGVDVVYGHAAQITADGHVIQMLWAPPFDRGLLMLLDPITQPSAFVRRRALSPPMLDETFHFAMDYALWLRLERDGCRFARIDRICAIDRHQPARKSSTITDVHAADLHRLATMYGIETSAERERTRSSFYRSQRIMGALLVPRVRGDLAFTAPADLRAGLLGRQLLTRRSDWPQELR